MNLIMRSYELNAGRIRRCFEQGGFPEQSGSYGNPAIRNRIHLPSYR